VRDRALPLLGLAVVVVALVSALAWWSAPDTGAPLAAGPRPRPAAPRAPEPQVVRTPTAPPPDADDTGDAAPEPAVVHDLTKVYDARTGFTEALVARTDRLATCWTAFVARADPGPAGRFTVELVVTGDGTNARVETNVVNEDVDADLEDCVSAAMADATFAPLTGVHRWVMPVPIPVR
jgi:hypothetical protein